MWKEGTKENVEAKKKQQKRLKIWGVCVVAKTKDEI